MVFCQYERNATKQYVPLKSLGFCWFQLLSWKMGISASFCPFFGHFRSLGPSLLLSQAREVILMGPRTGNAQKTGKTWQKYPFFSSTMEIARNLKISMLQLAISDRKIVFGLFEIASCSTEIFRFLTISIVEEKNVLFCQVLPVFLGISGPRAHHYCFSSLREK